jgi:hypothetical protein
MSQVAFTVILLFALGEGKGGAAFGTRDFKVWHLSFSTRGIEVLPLLLLFRNARGALLSTTVGESVNFILALGNLCVPIRSLAVSVLLANGLDKYFVRDWAHFFVAPVGPVISAETAIQERVKRQHLVSIEVKAGNPAMSVTLSNCVAGLDHNSRLLLLGGHNHLLLRLIALFFFRARRLLWRFQLPATGN